MFVVCIKESPRAKWTPVKGLRVQVFDTREEAIAYARSLNQGGDYSENDKTTRVMECEVIRGRIVLK